MNPIINRSMVFLSFLVRFLAVDRTTREEQGRRADRSGLANRPQAVVYCRGQLRSPEVALVAVMTGRSMGRRGPKLACDPALASFYSTIFRLHLYPVRFFPARDQATLAREPQPVLFVELFQPSPAAHLSYRRLGSSPVICSKSSVANSLLQLSGICYCNSFAITFSLFPPSLSRKNSFR